MKKLVSALKALLLISVFIFIGRYIFKEWSTIYETLRSLNLPFILITLLGLLFYQFLNASVWKQVLASIGEETNLLKTTCLWLQTESLKWIPGGIWGYGSRIIEAKRLGVSKTKASASLVVELILTIVAWAAVASMLFFTPFRNALTSKVLSALSQLSPTFIILIGVSVLTLSILCIAFARKKLDLIRSIAFLPKKALIAFLSYLFLCTFNGTLLWTLCLSTDAFELPLVTAIGASGLAWLIGFFAIGIPGGIGVREGAVVAAVVITLEQPELVTVMSAIAIVWRLLQVLAELASLCIASITLMVMRNKS